MQTLDMLVPVLLVVLGNQVRVVGFLLQSAVLGWLVRERFPILFRASSVVV